MGRFGSASQFRMTVVVASSLSAQDPCSICFRFFAGSASALSESLEGPRTTSTEVRQEQWHVRFLRFSQDFLQHWESYCPINFPRSKNSPILE